MHTGHSRLQSLRPITASVLALGLVLASASTTPSATAAPATGASAAKATLAWHPVQVQAPEGGPTGQGAGAELSTDVLSTGNMTCLSRSDCVVAGYLEDEDVTPGTYHGAVWHWNGKTWAVQATGTSGDVALVGTACPSAADCWAVGIRVEGKQFDQTVGLIDHFSGTTWSPSALPGATGVALNGVSCPSASNCVAVGNQQTSTDAAHALAYRWDGKTWSLSTAPSPAGALWTVLDSVDCFSATNCLAIGDADNSTKGSGYFFGEHFNGTSWSLFTMSNKDKFNMGNETDITLSCSDDKSCLAFGSALGYTAGQMGADFPFGLSYHWDGSSWASLTMPKGSGDLSYFFENGSCTTSAGCWGALGVPGIVGGGLTSDIAVAHWDGTGFQLSTISSKGYLSSIGCLPASTGTWCVGLGEAPSLGGTGTQPSKVTMTGGYFIAEH